MARAYTSPVICRSNGPAAGLSPPTRLSSRAVRLTDIFSWGTTLIRKMAGPELLAIPAARHSVGSGQNGRQISLGEESGHAQVPPSVGRPTRLTIRRSVIHHMGGGKGPNCLLESGPDIIGFSHSVRRVI